MNVVLGAHNVHTQEPGQQHFAVAQVFQNNYDAENKLNDVLLIQVGGQGREGGLRGPHSFSKHSLSTHCILGHDGGR